MTQSRVRRGRATEARVLNSGPETPADTSLERGPTVSAAADRRRAGAIWRSACGRACALFGLRDFERDSRRSCTSTTCSSVHYCNEQFKLTFIGTVTITTESSTDGATICIA